jgi:hypothetical protein
MALMTTSLCNKIRFVGLAIVIFLVLIIYAMWLLWLFSYDYLGKQWLLLLQRWNIIK